MCRRDRVAAGQLVKSAIVRLSDAERGGQLHEQWIWQIEHRLDELALLERDGKTSELEDIRAHAPNAIPGPLMRTLWRLLLSGRVKSPLAPRQTATNIAT